MQTQKSNPTNQNKEIINSQVKLLRNLLWLSLFILGNWIESDCQIYKQIKITLLFYLFFNMTFFFFSMQDIHCVFSCTYEVLIIFVKIYLIFFVCLLPHMRIEGEKTADVDCVEIKMNCKPISKYRKLKQKEYGLGMTA